MRHLLYLVAATGLLVCIHCPPTPADDWPQWLGPKRDGVWRETGIVKEFPAQGPTVRWRTPIGGGYAGSTSNISANVPLGAKIGATPDGRKAGEPIAEGVSAVHGTDTRGPTTVLHSVSKLPTIKMLAQLLNIRLSPVTLATEAGLKRLENVS